MLLGLSKCYPQIINSSTFRASQEREIEESQQLPTTAIAVINSTLYRPRRRMFPRDPRRERRRQRRWTFDLFDLHRERRRPQRGQPPMLIEQESEEFHEFRGRFNFFYNRI